MADPLLDVGLFADHSFSAMLIGLSLYGLVGASSMLFITQFLQSVAGLTPFDAALCLLPGMVAGTASATLSPLLGRRVRPAYLIGGGVLHWFERGAVEGVPRPDVLGDPDVLAGDVVVPAEQVLQSDRGGLAALRDQNAVAVDGGDLGDLGPVRPA